MKHRVITTQSGFSVVEVIVVMAIIGLFTVAIVLSGTENIQVQRFSGNLRNFADAFRQGQTASYSVKSGNCPLTDECFWRGTLFEFETGDPDRYVRYRLRGSDVAAINSRGNIRRGIHAKAGPPEVIDLNDRDMRIASIGINCAEDKFGSSFDCNDTTAELSVAFLAPDGRSFIARETYTNTELSGWNSNDPPPYNEQQPVTFKLNSLGTALTGYVTFDPKNANVRVQVK